MSLECPPRKNRLKPRTICRAGNFLRKSTVPTRTFRTPRRFVSPLPLSRAEFRICVRRLFSSKADYWRPVNDPASPTLTGNITLLSNTVLLAVDGVLRLVGRYIIEQLTCYRVTSIFVFDEGRVFVFSKGVPDNNSSS